MTDREKVIKGLDICLQRFRCGEDCPYYELECEQLREDALALLKEQNERIKLQEAIIEQYHRADGFLAVHGWKWEER